MGKGRHFLVRLATAAVALPLVFTAAIVLTAPLARETEVALRSLGGDPGRIYPDPAGGDDWVDTSLLDAGVGLSVWEATQYFSRRGIPEREISFGYRKSQPTWARFPMCFRV